MTNKFYILKQIIPIFILILFTFAADRYVSIAYFELSEAGIQQLILFVAIAFIFFIYNQLIFNYAEKRPDEFMRHKIWNKMFIIILILLAISMLNFIIVFFTTPLESLISTQPWIMFFVMYYFLFLINLFVLSLIHKVMQKQATIRKKLMITWAGSSLLVALILFSFPNF